MDKCEIVNGFRFQSDQESTGSFNDPTTSLNAASVPFRPRLYFGRDVRYISAAPIAGADCFGIMPLVRTEMLSLRTVGRGRLTGALTSVSQTNFVIMHIAAVDRDSDGNACVIGEHGTLHTKFPSIGQFFPTERRLGHRPAQTLALQVDADDVIVLLQG